MNPVCPCRIRPGIAVGLIAALALVVAGCGSSGPEMASVYGTVTYQGKPLEKGTISFVSTDPERPNASGTIQPDGTYELQTREPDDGAQVGDYRVAVTDIDPEVFNSALPGEPVEAPKSAIPEKYQNAQESGLTAKVESGSNNLDFDLK